MKRSAKKEIVIEALRALGIIEAKQLESRYSEIEDLVLRNTQRPLTKDIRKASKKAYDACQIIIKRLSEPDNDRFALICILSTEPPPIDLAEFKAGLSYYGERFKEASVPMNKAKIDERALCYDLCRYHGKLYKQPLEPLRKPRGRPKDERFESFYRFTVEVLKAYKYFEGDEDTLYGERIKRDYIYPAYQTIYLTT